MKRYVLRRVLEDGEEFMGDGGIAYAHVDDGTPLLSWGSRLSAETWMETRGIDGLLWRPFPSAEVAIKLKQLEVPFDLVIKDPLEAVEKMCQAHWDYCERIEHWLSKAGVTLPATWQKPTPCMTITAPTWAGIYSPATHTCHYPVVYAMIGKDCVNMVTAHEVVHAYQRQFTGHSCGHGPDFYAMMRHGMDLPITDHHHSYNTSEAKRLSDKLFPWWSMARERGALQSLPCEVLVTKTKRKGIK